MFRLIRLVMFTGAAFVAGIVYQMSSYNTACETAGGTISNSICERTK
ncbi:hypothetical protein [Nereida sp. MMG025]|nr:hypothetical protein [Nereida sp. MMG025]MCF6444206.1 hypothetical protein [Nereida sp. MMG025]